MLQDVPKAVGGRVHSDCARNFASCRQAFKQNNPTKTFYFNIRNDANMMVVCEFKQHNVKYNMSIRGGSRIFEWGWGKRAKPSDRAQGLYDL